MGVVFMYSCKIPEDKKDMFAFALANGIEASYKDLCEVCGRIKGKRTSSALSLLERAAEGEIPIMFKTYNKRLGHRRELGGKKGRYPEKAAGLVLKVLKSAIANADVVGLNEERMIFHAAANKTFTYPRLSPKGRRNRANYELAKIEIVLREVVETPKEKKEHKKAEQKAKSDVKTDVKATVQKEVSDAKGVAKKEKLKTEEKSLMQRMESDQKI